MVFQYLHKGIETAELEDLEKTKKQLGDLNFHFYEAYKLIESVVKNVQQGESVDNRAVNADLRGHLLEAERLLQDLQALTHKTMAEEEERQVARKRRDEEEAAYLRQIEAKYNIRIGYWDRRANVIELKDINGHQLTFITMPDNTMGFKHPNFKQTFENLLIAYLHRNGLLVPGKSSRGFDIEYKGNALEMLHQMGITIDGAMMKTPQGGIDLNAGTPTEKITFTPIKKGIIRMDCRNVRGGVSVYVIRADKNGLVEPWSTYMESLPR